MDRGTRAVIGGFAPYRHARVGITFVCVANRAPHPADSGPCAISALVCPDCASELVQALGIERRGTERWELRLRCPDCDWTGNSIFATHEIEEIEQELDRGYDVLIRELSRLVQANMGDYVDRFLFALRVDAIQPMDF